MDGSGYGNPDRGWNDPPKLAFSRAGPNTTAGPGRHRLLNKRVPIPINPQGGTVPSHQPASLKASEGPPIKAGIPLHPPTLPPCPPPATTTATATATTPLPGCTDVPAAAPAGEGTGSPSTQELLQQVHGSLSNTLKVLSDKLKEATLEEIRKRIDVMEDMWQQEQLSREVQKRMQALTQALTEKDYDKAWAVHQSLIVDYTTTCSPWMVGIKTLIAEIRSQSQTTADQDEPADESSKKCEAEQDPDSCLEGDNSIGDESCVK